MKPRAIDSDRLDRHPGTGADQGLENGGTDHEPWGNGLVARNGLSTRGWCPPAAILELDRIETALFGPVDGNYRFLGVALEPANRKKLEKDWEATVAKLVAYEGEPDEEAQCPAG